jgi:hypothetical protein
MTVLAKASSRLLLFSVLHNWELHDFLSQQNISFITERLQKCYQGDLMKEDLRGVTSSRLGKTETRANFLSGNLKK